MAALFTADQLVVAPFQQVVVTCDAYLSGNVFASLSVTGGSVTADGRRSVLRDATLVVAPTVDLSIDEAFALMVTPGLTLGVSRGWRLPDGSELLVPLGRFIPDTPEIVESATGQQLTVSATDVAIKVQRARWTDPYQIVSGSLLAEALIDLLADRYPPIQTAITSDICPEVMTAGLVLDAGDSSDPWADAVNLAGAYGYALYPDTSGVVTVRRVSAPASGAPRFVFARGATSILTDITRSSPLERSYNGVIASGEGSEIETPVRGEMWDENPSSPSYYLGPFGKVPYFYASPLLTTVEMCESAAAKLLAGLVGRIEELSWSSLVHPGLQPLDVVALEQPDGSTTVVLLDSLTIPLDVGGTMAAVAREIRVSY